MDPRHAARRRERASQTVRLPRVLVIGRDLPVRQELLELFQARGIKAAAIESGIGAIQLIVGESLNMVVVLEIIDAMSPEAVVRLLRENARTAEVGVIAVIDPRSETLEGADRSVIRTEALDRMTDLVVDVFDRRNPAPIPSP